jgi:nucleoside-diphosphate-sugar epimerase
VARGHAEYAGVRAVVLGASGFVGSCVAAALAATGADVVPVARDRASAERVLRARGVGAEVVACDLCGPGAEDLIASLRPAIVFNLAGYGVDPGERDAEVARRVNVEVVETVCRAVARGRTGGWSGAAVVHVGTAAEYGAAGGVLAEDTEPRPTGFYGRTKLEGTRRLAAACEALGLRGVTARLFTVFGPGEHAGRLLPSLLAAARSGEPLPLTSGAQRRDFTYVGDVADGVLRLGLAPALGPGELVNLATGRLLSVRHFARVAASVLGIPESHLLFGALPTRADEMAHEGVSVARIRGLLSWVPQTSVEEGVRATRDVEAAPRG